MKIEDTLPARALRAKVAPRRPRLIPYFRFLRLFLIPGADAGFRLFDGIIDHRLNLVQHGFGILLRKIGDQLIQHRLRECGQIGLRPEVGIELPGIFPGQCAVADQRINKPLNIERHESDSPEIVISNELALL